MSTEMMAFLVGFLLIKNVIGFDWCILPGMVHLRYFDTCSDFVNYSSNSIEFEGMKGEWENIQILIEYNNETDGELRYMINDLVNTTNNEIISKDEIMVYQVGHVNCSETTRYPGSGGGWRPDPMFTLTNDTYGDSISMSNEYSQILWISINIPYQSKTQIYTGIITIYINDESVNIPVSLNVWDISVPNTLESAFQTVFNFNEYVLTQFYNSSEYNITEMTYKYYDLLTEYRIPPDNTYISNPRSISDYEYLSTKTQWFNLEDIQSKANSYQSSILKTPNILHNHGILHDSQCTNYTEYQINMMINSLNNTIQELISKNIPLNMTYVYGFDEVSPSCQPGMTQYCLIQ